MSRDERLTNMRRNMEDTGVAERLPLLYAVLTLGELADAEPFDPARIAHSFAMKHGLRAHMTYEQAMALEDDLTIHLRAWRASFLLRENSR